MKTQCKLCGTEGPLCYSHIIPEFMYKNSYDEKNRFLSLPAGADLSPRSFQRGFGQQLLCKVCEGKLSKHEGYVAELMRQIDADPTPPYQFIQIPDFDYKAIKLFALGVLWKASVSTLPLYTNVTLGPHQEKIHQMLLNDDPGTLKRYALFLTKFSGSLHIKRYMLPPTAARLYGMRIFQMVALGVEWTITVSNHFTGGHNPDITGWYVGMHEPLLVPVVPKTDKELAQEVTATVRTASKHDVA